MRRHIHVRKPPRDGAEPQHASPSPELSRTADLMSKLLRVPKEEVAKGLARASGPTRGLAT